MTNQILVEASPAPMLIDDSPHEAFTEAAVGFVLINGTLHLTLTASRSGYRANPEPDNILARMGFAAGTCHFKLHALEGGTIAEQSKAAEASAKLRSPARASNPLPS